MTNALGGALGVQQYVLLFLWGVLLWGVCREVRDFMGMPQGREKAASKPPRCQSPPRCGRRRGPSEPVGGPAEGERESALESLSARGP